MSDHTHLDGVVISRSAAAAIDRFAGRATKATGTEVIGLLFGLPFETVAGERGVWIVHADLAAGQTGSAIHVEMPAEAYGPSWAGCREAWHRLGLDELRRDPLVVGWWHSHPNMDVFMSGTDVDNARTQFSLPWQVSYVVAPPGPQRAFFGWTEDALRPDVRLPAHVWSGPDSELRWHLREQTACRMWGEEVLAW
ncbi:MAG: Mov34/MPN/PAD-1 family protein [Coriobacteriia bacterium]|nr:Mov34/MPN/PAD-1 family protein [Coriobacteriia bacterium]